jgi:hypothetical protein
MSLLHQQNILAKLYTEPEFRQKFLDEPIKIGTQNGLNEAEIKEISESMAEELKFFSDSLFWKRFREVEKLLPKTKETLGKDFEPLFREFSANYFPESIKKHLEDAIKFCEFLESETLKPEIAKDIARFEKTRHQFFGYDKPFKFCYLRHNIFTKEKKKGFSVWLRLGNRVKHFTFFV